MNTIKCTDNNSEKSDKIKVLLLTNVPSPYMVDFLNELGKHCKLKAIFERGSSSERHKSWKSYNVKYFDHVVLKGINIDADKALCLQILAYIKKNKYNHIIVTNPLTPTGIIALVYMKILRIPYIIPCEGAFPGSGRGLKEGFKKIMIQGAELYFSTCQSASDYLMLYGAKKEKIVKYPFTTSYETDILKNIPTFQEKKNLRRELNISEQKVILSVGRFIYQKGFDVLLNACKNINNSTGVYILGGEPLAEHKRLKDQLKLSNVHFIGFKSKNELSKYYKAADLFVLPTREDTWGLVINEAMAHGLPVITTDRCCAGLELIEDYKNGFVVPVDDEIALANRINEVLLDGQLIEKFSKESLRRIQWYTLENMANIFIDHMKQ